MFIVEKSEDKNKRANTKQNINLLIIPLLGDTILNTLCMFFQFSVCVCVYHRYRYIDIYDSISTYI